MAKPEPTDRLLDELLAGDIFKNTSDRAGPLLGVSGMPLYTPSTFGYDGTTLTNAPAASLTTLLSCWRIG